MLANAGREPMPEGGRSPLDALVVDPTGRPPLCDEQTFERILREMVADAAPRLFAVMQVYGDRVDARCAAWGMAFEDRVDVVGVDGTVHKGARSPEDTLFGFGFGTHIRPRVVWVDPAAATRHDDAG